jgi:hypothetical protein
LPVGGDAPGTPVSVDLFGRWVDGVVVRSPLFDPKSERVHA